MFPLVLLVVTFAREGLALWLGAEFARNSTSILQCIGIGVFLSSLNRLPVALIQGAGRPDLTAKLNFVELVFYLPLLWWLTQNYGIIGTAVVWTGRVVVDTVLVFLVALWLLPAAASSLLRMSILAGAAVIVLAIGTQLSDLAIKGLFMLFTLPTFALMGWFVVLVPKERQLVRKWLKTLQFSH